MCRAAIAGLSMFQSFCIVCDGVFDTMNDCKRTLASPRPKFLPCVECK